MKADRWAGVLSLVVVATVAWCAPTSAAAPSGSSASNAALLGPLPGSTPMSIDVALKPRDPAALAAFVTAVSTPTSPEYADYLAPGAFGERFGAAPSVIATMTDLLRQDGLNSGPVSANGLLVPIEGTVSSLSDALGISLVKVRLSSGAVADSHEGTPSLPASLLSNVEGFVGLESVDQPAPELTGASTAPAAAPPCSDATNVSPSNQGANANGEAGDQYLTMSAIMKAYGADDLYRLGDEGRGVSIDVFEEEGAFPSDFDAYEACFGLHTPITYTSINGGGPAPNAAKRDGLETALDIETLATVAPEASLHVYSAPESTRNTVALYSAMISADDAQVISTSWGECEEGAVFVGTSGGPLGFGLGLGGGTAFLHTERDLFEQAAAQGQTIVAASGDSGAEDCAPAVLSTLPIDPTDPIPLTPSHCKRSMIRPAIPM